MHGDRRLRMTAAVQPVGRDLLSIDRSKVSLTVPLRNALGVFVPLLLGALTGHLLVGVSVSIGALNVAFSDRPASYRVRAGIMLLASLAGAISAGVGAAIGEVLPAVVILATLWAVAGGLLVVLGPAAEQIGLTAIVLLIVEAGLHLPAETALPQAGLVLLGGLLQVVLAVLVWPVRGHAPERTALAAVYRTLANYARDPEDWPGVPVTGEITNASTMLLAGSARGDDLVQLRAFLDEAERIRLELIALAGARRRLQEEAGEQALLARIDGLFAVAGDVLAAVARAVDEDAPVVGHDELRRRTVRWVEEAHALPVDVLSAVSPIRRAETLAHLDALAGQLRACLDIAAGERVDGEPATRLGAGLPSALRWGGGWNAVHANLTLRSAAFRHALRLAVAVAAGELIGPILHLPRAYWIPMTVAIVLKPGFSATITRGVGRIVGTLLGLVIASGLTVVFDLGVHTIGPVVLIGILVFTIRSIGPSNFTLSAAAVTALVVVLVSLTGVPPDTTILDRGLDTLIGGALALGVYLVWPTWEHTQTPAILAGMLDCYRRYFDAVTAAYVYPHECDWARLENLRLEARVARSNADASVGRLQNEPLQSSDTDLARSIMAASHRFVRASMALEGVLYRRPRAHWPLLRAFAGEVHLALQQVAERLRDPYYDLEDLPDLRAAHRKLAAAANPNDPGQAVIVIETDRITDSVNTMAQQLQSSAATTSAA